MLMMMLSLAHAAQALSIPLCSPQQRSPLRTWSLVSARRGGAAAALLGGSHRGSCFFCFFFLGGDLWRSLRPLLLSRNLFSVLLFSPLGLLLLLSFIYKLLIHKFGSCLFHFC